MPENPRAAEGCYQVTGVFNGATGALAVIAGVWYLKPRNYLPAAFNGTVDPRGENFEGRIVGLEGCASVFPVARRAHFAAAVGLRPRLAMGRPWPK